jgi:molybdopterin-containing oxidoreductase family iron-sulfur binding subunit
MNRGEIHTLILHGVNPVYDYSEPQRFLRGLEKVALSVAFSDRYDETSEHVHAICPDHHFLEKWGDAEAVATYFSLAQPLTPPLFDTRSAQESLLKWAGHESDHYTYLREFWRRNALSRGIADQGFDAFWDSFLRDGVRVIPRKPSAPAGTFRGGWETAARRILDEHERAQASGPENYELAFYESVAMRDGRHANNPWLQELPDPITKVTWGNYAAIAPQLARTAGLSEGDVVLLKSDRGEMQLPVFIQPGQQEKTISVAMGYGRGRAGKVGSGAGVNVFPLTSVHSPFRRFAASRVALEKTGRQEKLATTQSHFYMEGRPIVLETVLSNLRNAPASFESKAPLPTLWPEARNGEHSWGLSIDMSACTGCSACVIACQSENNVPVVGKDQVQRIRIMHWIRIDRYYSGPEENPATVHQPMMCQHCGHAPCETVCPVHATTTSSEGINQQVYNRCIGTRYCANNCPYKVRRFNWYNYTGSRRFEFNSNTALARMVLNPDVVVRSRGVMEKCNLCVQRIQIAKNLALQETRKVIDGEIKTACQQACPTEAIVFGDLQDPDSRVSRLQRSQRNYRVLEELGTRPNVAYLKKVRNTMGA